MTTYPGASPLRARMRYALIIMALAALMAGCAGKTGVKEDPGNNTSSAGELQSGLNPEKTSMAATSAANPETVPEKSSLPGESDPFAEDPFAEEITADAYAEHVSVADPIEPVNRAFFWVNDKLYFYLVKPLVRGYRFVFPEFMRTGVSNVFKNLTEPVYLANNLLQLEFKDATANGARFFINTTLGVFGLMDVAGNQGAIPRTEEDLGLTLGNYGVGHGFYLVLPFFGPSSLRDGIGKAGDIAFHPLTYSDLTLMESAGVRGVDIFNEISLDKDTYEAIIRQAIDPYATLRDAYIQRRKFHVEK